MATFEKRSNGYRFRVRKGGVDQSETFRTKAEGQAWATALEADIDAGRRGGIPDKLFRDVVERYLKEKTPHKRGAQPEAHRLSRTLGPRPEDEKKASYKDVPPFHLGLVSIRQLDETHVGKWRDWRMQTVGKASTRREWQTLSNVCNVAIKEWKWMKSNPFAMVPKPAASPPRKRRPEGDEIERILHCLGYHEEGELTTISARVGAAALFAIETAMREGEIAGLTKGSIRGRVAHLDKTKNGDERDVPLSTAARAIIARLPSNGDGPLFGLKGSSIDALWRKAKGRAGVEGLTFHDLRREATTRLAKKFDVLTLAKITGHRDIQLLARVYYAPTMEELADKLD